MKKKNTNKKTISKRRERVQQLYEKGYSSKEMIAELNCSYDIISRDCKSLGIDLTKRNREKNKDKINKRRERAKELYIEGYSYKEIATKLKCHDSTVRIDLNILGVKKTKKDRISQRREQIKELYEKGSTGKEIASQLNCHYMTVWGDLKDLGNKRIKKEAINTRREKIKELCEKGYFSKEIATQLNCHYATIMNDLKALGLSPNKKTKKLKQSGKTQKEMIRERQTKVKELYEKGYSCEEIATELEYSRLTICNDCKALGINITTRKTQKEAVNERREAVKQLHEKGYTQKEIAAKLHYSDMTIYYDLKALNKKNRS